MSNVTVGQKIWIMLAANFYGVRKIPATVTKIGNKYVYVQPHDKTYKEVERLEKKTLTQSSHGMLSWTGYINEADCDADFDRGVAYRRLTAEFFHRRTAILSDDFVALTHKMLATMEQHDKEKA